MWSKGPFSRSRKPVGNHPTPEEMTDVSASADPSLVNKFAKDLPALPSTSDSSLPQQSATVQSAPGGIDDKRYSAVSPVGSREFGSSDRRDSGSSFCVSPIDETDRPIKHDRNKSRTSVNAPLPQTGSADPVSSAPEPAQSVPKNVQFASHEDQIQPVRWDDYSGEPRNSNNGKTSQVNPRNTTFHKPSGSHASNFLHGVREQLQTKKKLTQARNRISSFSKDEAPTQKDSRGRSSSRVLPLAEHSGNITSTRDASPQFNNTLGFVPTTVTTITAGGGPPKTTLPERPATEHVSSNPRVYSDQAQQSEQRAPEGTKFIDAIPQNMMHPISRGQIIQPTMNMGGPNETLGENQRENLNFGSESTEDLPSIMSRRRPVPIGMPSSKKPVRKPTPAEITHEPALGAQNQIKDQPKDAAGRIESLEVKRDELAKRRHNLETVIHELTRVIQPGSFVYDAAAKAEVKKSVQSIENEIAEIKREEHELGLKVARAWRRLDEKENNGDGSNLWIKRVTS